LRECPRESKESRENNVEPFTAQTFGNSNRACLYHYL